MKLLQLPRSKVQLGVPLPWNVRDAQQQLLLSRGHVVDSEHQLEALLSRGAFVDVEDIRAAERQNAKPADMADARTQNLFGLWDQSADEMRKLMSGMPHKPELAEGLAEYVVWLIDLIDKDPDIALYHAVRQETAHSFFYGYNHALHTATLCLLVARRLNWPTSRTLSLVKAALTMNLPVLDLQGQLAEQDVPLRDSQKLLIQRHPDEAADWLANAGINDADWLAAVAQHHERSDGSGYPQGRTEVTDMAIALRTTDVFMAKISPRKLRPSMPIQEAARQLFREDRGGPMSTAVIKEFGIFPPGDVVRLACGEVGVVLRRTGNAKCPIVAAITDAAGHPSVRTLRRDTSQPDYAIVANVSDKSMVARMPPERVYGYASV